MRRPACLAFLFVLSLVFPAAAAEGEILHDATWSAVDLDEGLPVDLTNPIGKTRWEVQDLTTAATWRRTIREGEGETLSITDTRDLVPGPTEYSASSRDWWLPHLAPSRGGAPLSFTETDARGTGLVAVRTQPLGAGWILLPSGPREVRLERALVTRASAEMLVYRWIDPRAGLVAEAWGRPSADGGSIVELQGANTIENLIQGGLPLKIYSYEIESDPGERLALGYDRFGTCSAGGNPCTDVDDCGTGETCSIPINQVTVVPHATMGDLVAAGSWDFTPTQLADARFEVGSTTAPINSAETCNWNQCGFAGNMLMGREDKNFSVPADALITLSAQEGEQRAGDYTIWLRGAVRWEGLSGGLGEGESRTCYEGLDGGGRQRPEVPLWRFGTQDADGWFMQNGDSWTHTPFNCEQSVFNHVCGQNCGLFCPIWIKACGAQPNAGTQSSTIVAEGPMTTPSGHLLNTLVVRQVVDFCAYLGSGCSIPVETVHQVLHLWVAPNLGTVARLMSLQNAPDATSFAVLQETDLKYGLFPPRSISFNTATDTTLEISWDPGTITHHIDGYKVYWDTDSGDSTNYAFDSVSNAGQVSIVGTTATISGLTKGTDYYVTVTALSDFTNLSTGVMTTYESLLYPTTTSGTGGPLPPELMSTTTCTPIAEVVGVAVDKAAGSDIEICWNVPADVCVDSYTILGATTPESAGNFSPLVPDTGPVTCHTFNPTEGFFLVTGSGTGGSGPLGHFGQ